MKDLNNKKNREKEIKSNMKNKCKNSSEKPYKEGILEKCLPIYLENDLKNLKEGIKNNVSYLDCLIDELQGLSKLCCCRW